MPTTCVQWYKQTEWPGFSAHALSPILPGTHVTGLYANSSSYLHRQYYTLNLTCLLCTSVCFHEEKLHFFFFTQRELLGHSDTPENM